MQKVGPIRARSSRSTLREADEQTSVMAAPAVQFPSFAENLSRIPDFQVTEPCHDALEEKACTASTSLLTDSSSASLIIRRESPSPEYKYDLSSIHPFENCLDFKDNSEGSGELNNFEQAQKLCTRKSRAGTYVLEKSPVCSTFQYSSGMGLDLQTSKDFMLGGTSESGDKSSRAATQHLSDNDWIYDRDYSVASLLNNPSSSNDYQDTTTKFNYNQFSTADLASRESKSQDFDFDLLKKTYGFEGNKQTNDAEDNDSEDGKSFKPPLVPSWKQVSFETSELAMRLRSSVQSDFLSSELRVGSSPKGEGCSTESRGALRTIDEILKQYGISNNVRPTAASTLDGGSNTPSAKTKTGLTNLSQNNETSSSVKPAKRDSRGPALSGHESTSAATNRNLNPAFGSDAKMSSFSCRDSKNLGSSGFLVNVSQNNETSKSQGSLENDSLRRFGSSVDYTSSGYGKYTGSSLNLGAFDYGKKMAFPGDTTAGAGSHSSTEAGSTDKIKFEGSQVDLANTPGLDSRGSRYDLFRSLASATDALEYSMSSERQRLRKLDTMISSTPFYSSALDFPRPLTAQYKSPENYSSYRSRDVGNKKMFSSPTLPSSSGYGTKVSQKSSWAGNVGQRGSNISLSKSRSAPGSGRLSQQAAGKNGSSTNSRPAYLSYKPKFNVQQNNCVHSSPMPGKFSDDSNANKNQKKNSCSMKGECHLQHRPKKDAPGGSDSQSRGLYRTASGIAFLDSSRMDKDTAAEKKRYIAKSGTKKAVCTKKQDLDFSKNACSIYDGFDFVKDLNRMWQETVFGSAAMAKPAVSQKQRKYTPYKPLNQSQEGKAVAPGAFRNMFCTNMQSSARASQSSWAVASPASASANLLGYESDSGLKLAQKVQASSSVGPQNFAHEKYKRAASTAAKQKTNAPSFSFMSPMTAAPKSILKQASGKPPNPTSSSATRPRSAVTSSSKSFTHSASHTPYQLVRGFSPTDTHKPSRGNPTATAKRIEPSTKQKSTGKTSAGHKQGRRI